MVKKQRWYYVSMPKKANKDHKCYYIKDWEDEDALLSMLFKWLSIENEKKE